MRACSPLGWSSRQCNNICAGVLKCLFPRVTGQEGGKAPVLCFQTPPFLPTPNLLHPSPSSLHSFPPSACRSRSQACWGDSQVKSIKHLPPRSLLTLETRIPEKKHLKRQEFWVSTARREGWPTPRGRMRERERMCENERRKPGVYFSFKWCLMNGPPGGFNTWARLYISPFPPWKYTGHTHDSGTEECRL